MPTPEEKYYDGMNTLLAPVRALKSLMMTALLLVIAIGIGLAYPIIQLCNGEPLSAASFLVPFLTALALFTFFYAPYYCIFGGLIGLFVLGTHTTLITDYGISSIIFIFLCVGILQKWLRYSFNQPTPTKAPPRRRLGGAEMFCAELNQARLERLTLRYNALPAHERDAMIAQYGENFMTWPETVSESVSSADNAADEFISAGMENAEVVNAIAGIASDLGSHVMEMARANVALSWVHDIPTSAYHKLLRLEVLEIISSLTAANGVIPDRVVRLYYAIVRSLNLLATVGWEMSDAKSEITQKSTKTGVNIPVTVEILMMYDARQNTAFAAQASEAFCSLVYVTAEQCTDSPVAVKMLASSYFERLRSYSKIEGGLNSNTA